jgi:hypothetical protein
LIYDCCDQELVISIPLCREISSFPWLQLNVICRRITIWSKSICNDWPWVANWRARLCRKLRNSCADVDQWQCSLPSHRLAKKIVFCLL